MEGEQMEERNQPTLEEHIDSIKVEWLRRIKEMNMKFKTLPELAELTQTLYTQRQIALEYNTTVMNKIAGLTKRYNEEYAKKYNHYKTNTSIYYKSDQSINAQINSDLKDMLYKIELMDKLSKYMTETVKTIDDMIYGVSNRIRIEEIIHGIDNSKRV